MHHVRIYIPGVSARRSSPARRKVHFERRGGIATAPPLRRSYSDRAVTSPGGTFQTDTNLANHRHRTRLLADCQWRCRWRCGLGRLRNTRSLTKTIPRDRRKLIKLMRRKWTFLPPRSHLIRQFVKRHLVTLRREQHVLAQWLRQYFCQDHGVRSVAETQQWKRVYRAARKRLFSARFGAPTRAHGKRALGCLMTGYQQKIEDAKMYREKDRKCVTCGLLEGEVHFLFVCPVWRWKKGFSNSRLSSNVNVVKYDNLFASSNYHKLCKLAKFIISILEKF